MGSLQLSHGTWSPLQAVMVSAEAQGRQRRMQQGLGGLPLAGTTDPMPDLLDPAVLDPLEPLLLSCAEACRLALADGSKGMELVQRAEGEARELATSCRCKGGGRGCREPRDHT